MHVPMVSDATRMAIVMLVRADAAADKAVQAGLLALLGDGPGALPTNDAAALLRLVGRGGAVLSPAEASARLGICRQTLWRWEQSGAVTIRKVRLGLRKVGLLAADVERAAGTIAELSRNRRDGSCTAKNSSPANAP